MLILENRCKYDNLLTVFGILKSGRVTEFYVFYSYFFRNFKNTCNLDPLYVTFLAVVIRIRKYDCDLGLMTGCSS